MAADLGSDYMPYAPAAPVLNVIRRIRDGRLPDPLTLSALQQLGVAEGNADRVQKALRFLGLIDEEHTRTETFTRLGRVPTEEYPRAFVEVLQAAYAPVLRIVNPAEDTDIAVQDAFRGYEPSGQRPRMVSLFLALCREAGLEGGPVPARPTVRRVTRAQPPTRARARVVPPAAAVVMDEASVSEEPTALTDYRLLVGLIHQLPKDGQWTQSRRDRWVQALTANLDLLVEIEEEP